MNRWLGVVLLILLLTSLVLDAAAREMSRPDSVGGSYIVEVVSGVVFEEHQDVFELGLDFEAFIDGTNHHISLGVSSEIEFFNPDERYLIGPLLSIYYRHFKLFLTSGLLTDFDSVELWKNRIGLGYEIVWLDHWLIVPTVAFDHFEGETSIALSVGLACEF